MFILKKEITNDWWNNSFFSLTFVHGDINAFIQDLKNVPWHIVDDESNVNDAVLTWNK